MNEKCHCIFNPISYASILIAPIWHKKKIISYYFFRTMGYEVSNSTSKIELCDISYPIFFSWENYFILTKIIYIHMILYQKIQIKLIF